MSSLVRGCCAVALLTAPACSPRAAESPRHPSAEARNSVSDKPETEKKPRKQRPPVVAPPPAYGNKIVRRPEPGDHGSASEAYPL